MGPPRVRWTLLVIALVLCFGLLSAERGSESPHASPAEDLYEAERLHDEEVAQHGAKPYGREADTIKWRTDAVVRSDRDRRRYRALGLANGLVALLVSDAGADKAAAALDVAIGSHADPADVAGLAHFLEHLLFMGTAPFPDEGEYMSFLARHGGRSNAYTAGEHTNYHFDVDAAFLAPALERFALFFVAPLFRADCVQREISAVHAEHAKNVASDVWRTAQVERTVADPAHVYARFGTGSRRTLDRADIRPRVVSFFRRHYRADAMRLVVVGRESLEALEGLVARHFAGIRPAEHWDASSFTEESQLAHSTALRRSAVAAGLPLRPADLDVVLRVQKLREGHALSLVWQLPDMWRSVRSRPAAHVASLLGHEGAGSVLSVLRARAWATGLSAGADTLSRGYAFFEVRVELSAEGAARYLDVASLVLAYLRMAAAAGPQARLWDEEQRLRRLAFRFREPGPASSLAAHTAALLQHYAAADVLLLPSVATDYDPEAVRDVLSLLCDARRMRLVLCEHEPIAPALARTEEIYGTAYSVQPGLARMLDGLDPLPDAQTLHVPAPNAFVPNELLVRDPEWVLPPLPPGAAPLPAPSLLHTSPALWYKHDDTFSAPRGCLMLRFVAGNSRPTPRDALVAKLWARMLADALTETAYDAHLAGIEATQGSNANGLSLALCGYSERLEDVLSAVIDALGELSAPKDSNAADETLRVRVAHARRQAASFARQMPVRIARCLLGRLLHTDKFSAEDALATIADYVPGTGDAPPGKWGLADVLSFGDRVLRRAHTLALYIGDLPEERAAGVVGRAVSRIKKTHALLPVPRDNAVASLSRLRVVPPGQWALAFSGVPDSSCAVDVVLVASLPADGDRARALALLYAQVFREAFFDDLRTKQQLGYVVQLAAQDAGAAVILRFVVQSERPPPELERRIEDFIAASAHALDALGDDAFSRHVDALAHRLTARFHSLAAEALFHWNQVASMQLDFLRRARDAAVVRTLDRAELAAFVRERVLPGAPLRRRLAAHVWSESLGSVDKISALYSSAGYSFHPEGESTITSDVSCKTTTPHVFAAHRDLVRAMAAALPPGEDLLPAVYDLPDDGLLDPVDGLLSQDTPHPAV